MLMQAHQKPFLNLQALFCERQQALLHGDLHTGSFMVTQDTTYAIDAEFACYGPIAFDVCKMIANLLIAFFAADGLEKKRGDRLKQKRWILQVRTSLPPPPRGGEFAMLCYGPHRLWRLQDDRQPVDSLLCLG